MTAIVGTLNQEYRVTEHPPWWRVRLTAVALTVTAQKLVLARGSPFTLLS